jgi:DNA modification methylase
MQGDKAYEGATPSWVIWQVLSRYTGPGDVVLDPMAGSGTTLDVCLDLKRTPVVFDLVPSRPEIAQADARELPAEDESADFVFIDPPYSTHIDYSDHPECIGKLDAGAPAKGRDGIVGEAYYTAMEEVIAEIHRVLRPGRFMALYVQDSFKKTAHATRGTKAHPHALPGVFMPIGFELFTILRDYFEPADIVAVVRQNAKLARGNWHQAAEEGNFFLRGFNYLFILRKAGGPPPRGARTGRDG